MCGFLGFESKTVSNGNLKDYAHVLQHRGPDGTGEFQDGYISLLHWRLSIIDLSDEASQPFFYEDLVLVFNGEVYNYRDVALELSQKGYHLTTQSDTEVLIKAFHCWGEHAVDHFVGMFAFAVYNRRTKEIFLFRDRVGVKPLYYTTENGFAFGSEMKVFKALGKQLSIDPASVSQYFRFGYFPGERTIFREVKKLLPGHFIRFSNGAVQLKSYWKIPLPGGQETIHEKELLEELETTLLSSFKFRMVSDVPVGIFLSGGIDSSLLATLLQRNSAQTLRTFTLGFDQADFDETTYARQVAQRLGTDHVDLKLSVSAARDLFQKFYEIYDEPFSDTSGIPTALVASLARQHGVKVVLSADGADELFGGYPHYQRVNSFYRRLHQVPPGLRRLATATTRTLISQSLRSRVISNNFEHRVAAWEERIPANDIIDLFESSCSNQTGREIELLTGHPSNEPTLLKLDKSVNPQAAMMYWDASFFLPDDLLLKVDRATMFNSVEGREPFLDHRIIELAQRMPMSMKINGVTTKAALRKILYKYHPASLFDRPKQGFSIPIFAWFKNDLDKMFEQYLTGNSVEEAGLNKSEVQRELTKYNQYKRHGHQYNIEKMWRLLSFMMWFNRWMK